MVLYAILRGVSDYDTYEIAYVDEQYFKLHGHMDDSWPKEYQRFEELLYNHGGFDHSIDGFLNINCDMMEDEIKDYITKNFPDAKYSEELYNFVMEEEINQLREYDWTEEEIENWKNEIEDNKKVPIANWRLTARLDDMADCEPF